MNATVRPLEILIGAGTTHSRPQAGVQTPTHSAHVQGEKRPRAIVKSTIKVTLLPDEPEQPPPPKQNPEAAEKVMTRLMNEMALVLSRLETLIKDRGIILLLVFDLDDTLFQRSFQFGSEIEPLSLSQLKELQQIWFMQFHDFLSNNQDSVYLVYNTSRDSIALPSKHPQREEWGAIRQIRTVDGVNRRMMSFLSQGEPSSPQGTRFLMGIPIPDALITGTGRFIQTSATLQNSPSSQFWVNESIAQWLRGDQAKMKEASDYLKEHFNSIEKTSAAALKTLINREGFDDKKQTVLIPSTFDQATVTVTRVPGLEAFFYIQNVTVNKGTSLRILLNTSRIMSSDKTVIGVVYGDSVTDLSMLRPDLEIKATVPASTMNLARRNARLEAMGIPSDIGLFSALWWSFSVLPSKVPFYLSHNQKVKSSVQSTKVFEANGKGLLGLLQVTLGQLMSPKATEL